MIVFSPSSAERALEIAPLASIDRMLAIYGVPKARMRHARAYSSGPQEISTAITTALATPVEDRIERMRDDTRRLKRVDWTPFQLLLLREGGIDPLDAEYILMKTDNLQMDRNGQRLLNVFRNGDGSPVVVSLVLGPRLHIQSCVEEGDLLATEATIPETLAAAIAGRPLGDLATHPVLDAMAAALPGGIRVKAVERADGPRENSLVFLES